MSIQKRGKYWRAFLPPDRITGKRLSATFDTMAEAESWKAERMEERREGKIEQRMTFADLLDRYAREVSTEKKTARNEIIRIEAIKRDEIAMVRLAELDTPHFSEWTRRRLEVVSGSSVNREMNLLSHVCEIARREWKLLLTNPVRDVSRPKSNPHRKRRISDGEIQEVCLALGYQGGMAANGEQRVAVAFLFALETAMRSGEICKLKPGDIDEDVAQLYDTKNAADREVPLNDEAQRLLTCLPDAAATVFNLDDKYRDVAFRRGIRRTSIEDLTFHDSRHEAIWRLSKVFDVLELAMVTGHKNINELRTYYFATGKELAQKARRTN